MRSSISFVLDGCVVTPLFQRANGLRPTTTVLQYLRSLPSHRGVKEGCAEGDCGACTVVVAELKGDGALRYRALDSCLLFLPMLHGKQLITVENLRSSKGELHPVQSAMVELHGSQCGYCTPGIVMSLFALYKGVKAPSREEIEDAVTGNLCRCTGYRPIVDAAARACTQAGLDHFSAEEQNVARMLETIPADSICLETDDQHYFRPAALDEVLMLKHQLPEALVVSGATDIALRVTKGHETLHTIIDLSGVRELQEIREDGPALFIGAGVTLSDLLPHARRRYPTLADMLEVFGSRQIRNLATLGGNLGTASPIGDTLPVLMAHDARVALASVAGSREVSLDAYLTGYRKTDRHPDEIITGVVIPKAPPGVRTRAYKVSKRKDLDISTVSAGFRLKLDGSNSVTALTLAFGGMAEFVKRAKRTEQFLLGKTWSRESVEKAVGLLAEDFVPISDVRGSAEFRALVVRNLLLKFWYETRADQYSE